MKRPGNKLERQMIAAPQVSTEPRWDFFQQTQEKHFHGNLGSITLIRPGQSSPQTANTNPPLHPIYLSLLYPNYQRNSTVPIESFI